MKLVQNAIEKANQIDILELRRKREEDNTCDIIPFVHTYNPNNINIYDAVRATLPVRVVDKHPI